MKVLFENLDQKKIRKFLPHREPFLMVDRVVAIREPADHPIDIQDIKTFVGVEVEAIKNVTANEPHFVGHFPDLPIMPGVLILETMAQVASFSLYPLTAAQVESGDESYQCVLMGVDGARFRIPVTPGDTLRIVTKVLHTRSAIWSFDAVAYVGDKKVTEAKMMANMIPRSSGRTIF